jgi:hypothetical protein
MNQPTMMDEAKNFFKQDINSYLCIALLGLMAFWTCLYYLVHRAEAFGNALGENTQISELK